MRAPHVISSRLSVGVWRPMTMKCGREMIFAFILSKIGTFLFLRGSDVRGQLEAGRRNRLTCCIRRDRPPSADLFLEEDGLRRNRRGHPDRRLDRGSSGAARIGVVVGWWLWQVLSGGQVLPCSSAKQDRA